MIGNHRCLDFVNTELIEQGRRVDLLQDFGDLVDWLEQAHVLGRAQAKQVLRRWGRTSKGAGALSEARAFRRLLREMAEGIVHGKRPSTVALDKINALLRSRTVDVALVRTRRGFERQVSFQPREPQHLLVPVAESASDLLCHGDLALIVKCQNPRCILYLCDRSPTISASSGGIRGGSHQSLHHCLTLPCKSYNPQPFGANCRTGVVALR